jgi:hypothetical protein
MTHATDTKDPAWIETDSVLSKSTGKWSATATMKRRGDGTVAEASVYGFDTWHEAEKAAKEQLGKKS